MVNQRRARAIPRRRFRSLEEQEILGAPAPIISNENFRITEEFFVKDDLLPKPKSKRAIDAVP